MLVDFNIKEVEVLEMKYKRGWVRVRKYDGRRLPGLLYWNVCGVTAGGYGKIKLGEPFYDEPSGRVLRYRECGSKEWVYKKVSDISNSNCNIYKELNVGYLLTGVIVCGLHIGEGVVEVSTREAFDRLLELGERFEGVVKVDPKVSLRGVVGEDFECIGCDVIVISEKQEMEVDWGEVEDWVGMSYPFYMGWLEPKKDKLCVYVEGEKRVCNICEGRWSRWEVK